MRYHGAWQFLPEAAAGLPAGAEWLAGISAERPEGERHLAVHEGHITNITARDRVVLEAAGEAIATAGWVGTRDEIRAAPTRAPPSGTTELLYTPSGPDIPREIRSFADAVLG